MRHPVGTQMCLRLCVCASGDLGRAGRGQYRAREEWGEGTGDWGGDRVQRLAVPTQQLASGPSLGIGFARNLDLRHNS